MVIIIVSANVNVFYYFCFVISRNEMEPKQAKKKYFTHDQEKLAKYSKALSHPVRVYVMDFLANNLDRCCYSGDMADELPIARSTLSEHLKELKKAGLIQGEINPPYIKYCINRENWDEAKRLLKTFFGR
jgi:ArsR family transcriptional regulator